MSTEQNASNRAPANLGYAQREQYKTPTLHAALPTSLKERLEQDVKTAEESLTDARRALEIFRKMPDEIDELVKIAAKRGY